MDKPSPQISEEEEAQQEAGFEPPYRVIIHNDDVTPMNFVLYILQYTFMLAGPRAVQVMYTAHFQGAAYVDTLPKPEAQRRIHSAHVSSRLAGYPLLFTMERE